MLIGINHIGIAVKDLETSMELFKKIFSVENFHLETVESQKVSIASFKVGDVLIELTCPTSEDSPISKFLKNKGEGIHHIAFESDNIDKELERLKNNGINLINEIALIGAHNLSIAFLHPKSTNGALFEICQ